VNATHGVAIAAGDDHTLLLRNDGSAVAWGNTNFQQCTVPALGTSVAAIAIGSVHSLALIGQTFTSTVAAGQTAFLTAGSFGKAMASYQWQCNGTNIIGATNAALVLDSVSWANSGTYQVTVSNALGVATGQLMNLTVKTPFGFDNSSVGYVSSNAAFNLRLLGASGVNPVVIYASSNLLDWEAVFTNAPSAAPIDFTDTPPIGLPQRFYRAIELP
jgi:hypothetical protein